MTPISRDDTRHGADYYLAADADDLIEEQRRTIAALMVGMPDDGTTPVIVRIGRLEAEIDRLRAELAREHADHAQTIEDAALVVRENASLHSDAERYRWLRDTPGSIAVFAAACASSMNADVDAAMASPSRSQRMREAGFTRRPSAKSLPSDE